MATCQELGIDPLPVEWRVTELQQRLNALEARIARLEKLEALERRQQALEVKIEEVGAALRQAVHASGLGMLSRELSGLVEGGGL
jgi:uncharacterized small protein (DUF1192 family)